MTTEIEIDLPTGLPKLSIELLPDGEEEERRWSKYPRHDHCNRLPVRQEVMAQAAKVRASSFWGAGRWREKTPCVYAGSPGWKL